MSNDNEKIPLVDRIADATTVFRCSHLDSPARLVLGGSELQELMAIVEGSIALDPSIPMNEGGEANRPEYNGMKVYVVNAVNFLEVL